MLTDDTLNLITEQTNIHIGNKGSKIKQVTVEDIRIALGILLYMGQVRLPNTRDYWNGVHKQHPVINAMTISRFEGILRHLHFNNNAFQKKFGEPGYDSLFKVRPLITNCQKSFEESAELESTLSIDEMMAPFKGQLSLKCYMPNKPIQRGLKLWALCGSRSSYVYRFNVYGDNLIVQDTAERQIGRSGEVVLQLSESLPSGSELSFDNYFASPLLALRLKEKGIESTMTLRGNRKAGSEKHMSSEKDLKKKGRGSMDYVQSNGVLIVEWMDSKLVTVASTIHPANPVDKVGYFFSN